MTPQEAIEQLKYDMEMIKFNPLTGETFTLEQIAERTQDNYKAYLADELAIEALGKQIPKKPILKPWSPAICPSCGEELSGSLGDGYYKHYIHLERCPNIECSQRLDWSEGE